MEQYTIDEQNINDWIERGKKIIYPENLENWTSCVKNRAQDTYHGSDLETALQVMEALDNKEDMFEIEESLNRVNFSSNAHFLILKIILSFSKHGPEFMEFISHGDISDDLKLAIENQRKENERLEKIQKNDTATGIESIDRAITEAELLKNKDEKNNLDSLVNPNKSLQIRKEGIIAKIVNFIKGLFRPKYKAIAQHSMAVQSANNSTQDTDLINLQDKLENNQIKLSDLTDTQVKGLNSLYQNQIEILKQTLKYKKIEMDIREQIQN